MQATPALARSRSGESPYQDILFKEGDIVEHGEEAEQAEEQEG